VSARGGALARLPAPPGAPRAPCPRLRPAAGAALLLLSGLILPAGASAVGSLTFATAPTLPTLPGVTLAAKSQTVNTTMTNFAISDTRGTKSGWNIAAAGQSGVGKSAVFAQYCPNATCGSDPEGYVTGGQTMAAGSLRLTSTSAKFSGGTGAAPTFKCGAGCAVDAAAPVKIASAATGGAGESTWTTSGFSAASLSLSLPTTLRTLPNTEVYRVNIIWTLASGP
jgi:hypothetical protein